MADDQDVPRGDEPGASTTQYDDGKGTVGLQDRIGGGAPDTNQGKAEPMPPTPGHADPAGTSPHTDPPQVPDLGDMNVGAANPQIASPSVLAGDTSAPGRTLDAGAAAPAGSSSGSGTSHRAPGMQGETPDGESVETDVEAGAARMAPGGAPDRTAPPLDYPGDSQGVNVPHEQAAPGTSQESGIAHGVKDPAR